MTPADAYPQAQRRAHAEQHILAAAECGFLEQTSCWQICRTYQVNIIDDLKALRAKFRNELSFQGSDK